MPPHNTVNTSHTASSASTHALIARPIRTRIPDVIAREAWSAYIVYIVGIDPDPGAGG